MNKTSIIRETDRFFIRYYNSLFSQARPILPEKHDIIFKENTMRKILVIDDDEDLSFVISDMLENNGYYVECASDCFEAMGLLKNDEYHLILLDVNLPDATGFELCTKIREVSKMPIIFISARVNEPDKITGLDIGGDDYLTKPFSLKELLSRVNALIRRTYGYEDENVFVFGNVRVNTSTRTVTRCGSEVALSMREFDLLAYLIQNKNKAIPKEKILDDVWGEYAEVENSTLTVHIRWLRTKLEDDPSSPKYIKTIYKVGYMLEVTE